MTVILTKDGTRPIRSRYHKIVGEDGKPIDQHRHIMEQHLGRKLRTDEHVHHINGDSHDNRLENLELLTKREHFLRHQPEFKRGPWSASKREKSSGPNGPSAKLTWGQVDEIRSRSDAGESNASLAASFGLSGPSISRIVNGKAYRRN